MTNIDQNRNFEISAAIAFVCLAAFACFAQPKIEFDALEYTMPPVRKGTPARLDIPFRNVGDKPLVITRTQGSGVPSVSGPGEPIAPNGSGVITFSMPSDFAGTTRQRISINTNIDDQAIVLQITLTIYEAKRQVSGIVRDSFGELLSGVTATVDSDNHSATQTDFDGKYFITASPDEFLVFRCPGMKEKKIRASEAQINVTLENEIQSIPDYPPFEPNRKNAKLVPAIAPITAEDIENAGNPKYDFRKNRKSGVYLVYLSGSLPLEEKDLEFQEKYKLVYNPYSDHNPEYRQRYNKMVFKYLTRKFGKSWESGIRKDAIGLSAFLR